jgi:hypothetical protein
LPHYLPAWSSRAQTAACFHLDNNGLTLEIPVDHPVWCGAVCVFEVFGNALGPVDNPSADVGVGIKASGTRRCTRTSRHHGCRSTSSSRTWCRSWWWTGSPALARIGTR